MEAFPVSCVRFDLSKIHRQTRMFILIFRIHDVHQSKAPYRAPRPSKRTQDAFPRSEIVDASKSKTHLFPRLRFEHDPDIVHWRNAFPDCQAMLTRNNPTLSDPRTPLSPSFPFLFHYLLGPRFRVQYSLAEFSLSSSSYYSSRCAGNSGFKNPLCGIGETMKLGFYVQHAS
ncbi:hypothetical protein BDM02DRAFT_604697 [Thelephora ganbajun]|uniref:Uncharacterized protein n=1 Tax=Thelephora ganbajun TaxID=370292 RepID=A0ACB6Z6X5_THEGA|nr:hypothetical protein BDM02DRAFT_604697 [Thelephora ganbajun]